MTRFQDFAVFPESRPFSAAPISVDISWMGKDLAVGGRFEPSAVEPFAKLLRIRRVVDLRADETDDAELLKRHGIRFLHLPTPDTGPVKKETLKLGADWVLEGLAKNERALIHCEHGIGRSALLACCVMVCLGSTPSEALRIAKRARAIVSPTPDQLHALINWTREWHQSQATICPDDTWHDLACIAYRSGDIDADRR